ncbi:MAG: RNA-binding protein [Clostridia bacterium]|nr:RNA-binding protein [Clostridia bacterium]
MDNEERLKKRFKELAERAENGVSTFTDFLNLDEQQTLAGTKLKYETFGGYDGAERVMACFPSPWDDAPEYPMTYITVTPTAGKYSEELSHRDFLGALMSLGFKREMLGDILVSGNAGYIVCSEKMAEHIAGSLCEVRRTPVKCTVTDALPEVAVPQPKPDRTVVASDRADAVTASAFGLSRSEAQEFFASGRVFINAKATLRPDEKLKEGDIISVRGKGRIKFVSFSGETRKGRLWADILRY